MAAKHPPFCYGVCFLKSLQTGCIPSSALHHGPAVDQVAWAMQGPPVSLSLRSWIGWRDVCVLRWWERPRLPYTPGGIHITGASSVAHTWSCRVPRLCHIPGTLSWISPPAFLLQNLPDLLGFFLRLDSKVRITFIYEAPLFSIQGKCKPPS